MCLRPLHRSNAPRSWQNMIAFLMSLGWAQVWRRLYREDNLISRLRTDPHSPSEYRVNGVVRNIDAWYAAFGVDESDDLYLPPEQRVSIW